MIRKHLMPGAAVMTLALLLSGVGPGIALAAPAEASANEPNYVLANEINAFALKTFKMLSAKDYAGVEKLFQPYLNAYAAKKISAEDLALRFDPFSGMTEMESEFDGWIAASPKSYAARLARGIYFVEEAWRKRGIRMGNLTSDEQTAGFRRYLKKSREELTASLSLYARPVDSYRYLIRVAKGLDGDARSLLDEALRLDPRAVEARLEYLDTITPRWGGSKEEMTRFLNESKQSQMTEAGKTQVAGRYWYALAQQARLEKDYHAGSGYFYQGYLATHEANALLFSAEIAVDAKDRDLAIVRMNELIKTFPKSAVGLEYRGKIYEWQFDDAEHAIPDYIAAADLGMSWSQNHIGWFYMKGIRVPVDLKKARHYLELAAAQGNQTAKENIVILNDMERGK